ncbi:MAG TPA: YoaK family protein [Actinocrinis sp.]|nr:YoaK family protein [Actinocrinis sp.]
MHPVLRGAARTVLPAPGDRHGPLPPLLLGLTVVTGLVDAVSYLLLGHVFTANMTGNVVILGFALAGASGFSPAASLLALFGFSLGALVWGRLVRSPAHRGRTLLLATATEAVLFGLALVVVAAGPAPNLSEIRYPLIALAALAMGTQNAAVRALGVPDLATNVLTSTITGIAADAALGESAEVRSGRRSLVVVAMLLGALAGGMLVLHAARTLAVAVPFALILAVVGGAARAARSTGDWTAFL